MKRKFWPTSLHGSAVCLLLCLLSMTFACSSADGGEKSFHGVVEDAAGNPVKGIFVQAKNLKTGITTSVLSDRQGSYWFDNLPPGDYDLGTQAVGFTTDVAKNLGWMRISRRLWISPSRNAPSHGRNCLSLTTLHCSRSIRPKGRPFTSAMDVMEFDGTRSTRRICQVGGRPSTG